MENENKQEEEPKKDKLEQAQEVLSKLEEQNKIMADNLKKAEKMAITNMLGGSANAGQVSKESKEESPEEYKKKVMAGEL